MLLRHPHQAAVVLGALALCAAAITTVHAVEPLENAHAHNDYWHDRPLHDALDHGFTSVEADIFLVDGKLLVGHDEKELTPQRTLESLYLEPLSNRIRTNGGRVYRDGRRFILLVDIKTDAEESYKRLREALSKHDEMLTAWDGKELRPSAVTVVVSGNRPQLDITDERRFVGIDGRLSDLDSNVPAHIMPMISDNWRSLFAWNGVGRMPEGERAKLREVVRKSHTAGRLVRFWATPENETVWLELRAANVDLIGTDALDRLATFLRSRDELKKR